MVYKTNIALFLSLCLQQEQKNASSFGRPPVFSKKIKLFSLFLFTNAPFYAILDKKKIKPLGRHRQPSCYHSLSEKGGYKQIGVNSQTQFAVEAMDLADWLTNEANQIKRFETRALGPSNVNAAASDAVKANVALAALSLQSQFAVSQNDVLGAYWTPAEAFGTTMEAKDYSTDLQTLLDTMVAQITAAQ